MTGLRLALAGYKYRPRIMHRSHREIETCLESNHRSLPPERRFFFFASSLFLFSFVLPCSRRLVGSPRSHQILADLLFASAASSGLAFNVSSLSIFHGSIFCDAHHHGHPIPAPHRDPPPLLVPGPSITMSFAFPFRSTTPACIRGARARNALVQSPNPRVACVAGDQLPTCPPPICSALATDRWGRRGGGCSITSHHGHRRSSHPDLRPANKNIIHTPFHVKRMTPRFDRTTLDPDAAAVALYPFLSGDRWDSDAWLFRSVAIKTRRHTTRTDAVSFFFP